MFITEYYRIYTITREEIYLNKYGLDYSLIKEKEVLRGRKVYKKDEKTICFLDLNSSLLENCLDIATAKAKKTMNENQAGDVREMNVKIAKQLQGVVAETLVHLYLERLEGVEEVKRFDIERENFLYSSKEFDVDFIKNNKRYKCEIRSTIDHHNLGLFNWYKRQSIIGPYTNKMKTREELSDFYFSVVFLFSDKKKVKKYNVDTFEDDLRNKDIIPVLLSVASKKDMLEKAHFGSLGQKDTKYRLVKLTKLKDMSFNKIDEAC